jgi:protein gp37
MSLIESKGNMYEWTTHQWNPVGGECIHNCTYCYVNKWGKKRPLAFREKYLKDDLGSNRTIFVVSGGDLFARDVPDKWIERVIAHCKEFDNTYLFQSKNPTRIADFRLQLPDKSIICTTIETNRMYPEMGESPHPLIRSSAMGLFFERFVRYVTIEPIMDFDLDEMVNAIKECNPFQVNIGADSGNNHLTEPTKDKLLSLIGELQKFTTIAKKTNLGRILNT